MRFLLLTLAILSFMPAARAQEKPEGFRGMIWGATMEDVRKFETAKFYKEEADKLFFLEKPDEFRRLITYDFFKGKLTGGRYEYMELHDPDASVIMDMFGKKQIEFEKIYGETTSQEFIWKNKRNLYYPQFWARSLMSGDLRMRAIWQLKDTKVTLETYHDGLFYQFYYTAVAAKPDAPQNNGIILNLPGAKPEPKKQP